MPRKIITENVFVEPLDLSKSISVKKQFISNRELLKKRSSKYIQIINKLDIGNITKTNGFDELINQVIEEFGTADIQEEMLGIVSKCYLGENFVVHILDITGENIIKHFRVNEQMLPVFERARNLALHKSYLFVEVYSNKLICIKEDGTAVLIS